MSLRSPVTEMCTTFVPSRQILKIPFQISENINWDISTVLSEENLGPCQCPLLENLLSFVIYILNIHCMALYMLKFMDEC